MIRIAHKLKLTTGQFVKRYGICYIGQYSKLPLVIIRFENNRCPFLRSYGCQIHQVKPSICRRYPLGKVTEFKEGGKKEIIYFMQQLDHRCQGLEVNSKTTVGEFLKESEMEVYDEAGEIWNDIVTEGGKIVNLIEEHEHKEVVYEILSQVLYDPDIFKQQGKTPLEALELIKERVKGVVEAVKKVGRK